MSVFGRSSITNRSVAQALMSDLGPSMHPRISIRGGSFALVDASGQRYGAPIVLQNTAQGQKTAMLAIIIGSNPAKSRIYFESEYDPDNPGPPDCFSDNGVAPSTNASSPQARTCAECEWGKWGSDSSKLTGKKIKACSEKKKIGVVVVGDTTGLVYELQIPPATLKNMAKYVSQIVAISPPGENRKADPSDFVTAISFVPGQTGILEFEPHAWICSAAINEVGAIEMAHDAQGQPILAADEGAAVAARIDEIWNSDALDNILGLKDQPWTPPALNAPLPGMRGVGRDPTAPGGTIVPNPIGYTQPSPYATATAGVQPQNPALLPYTAPASPAIPPATATASQPSTLPRVRGGGTKPATVAPAPSRALAAPVVAQEEAIPPFLRRTAASTTSPPPPPPAASPSFGLIEAPAPTSALTSAIDKAMNLTLPRR